MTTWTARLLVLLYVAAVVVARRLPAGLRDRRCVWLWSIGATMLVLHVLVAFHEVHHWSWLHAVEHTTRATERIVGRSTGLELWVNLIFVGWWIVDSMVRLTRPDWRLPRAYDRCVQGAWAFMFFNATVVFGPAGWMWCLPLVVLGVAWPRRIGADSPPVT